MYIRMYIQVWINTRGYRGYSPMRWIKGIKIRALFARWSFYFVMTKIRYYKRCPGVHTEGSFWILVSNLWLTRDNKKKKKKLDDFFLVVSVVGFLSKK